MEIADSGRRAPKYDYCEYDGKEADCGRRLVACLRATAKLRVV